MLTSSNSPRSDKGLIILPSSARWIEELLWSFAWHFWELFMDTRCETYCEKEVSINVIFLCQFAFVNVQSYGKGI